MKLDQYDRRILSLLQVDNRRPSEAVAERIGLSASACQRRMKRLRAAGIIEADVSIVSSKAADSNIQMMVLVTLELERSDIIDRFKKAIRTTPEIVNGFYVTGEADFILYVTARDMEDYERFTRRFFYKKPEIKRFKTMVVMDRIKIGFALPLSSMDSEHRASR